MTEPPVVDAELAADLELLDDETRHAVCTICYPDLPRGVPFVALCGRRAIGFAGSSEVAPPNACPDCLAVIDEPCEHES